MLCMRWELYICQLWALGRAPKPEIVRKEAGRRWFASSGATPTQTRGDAPRAMEEEGIWSQPMLAFG